MTKSFFLFTCIGLGSCTFLASCSPASQKAPQMANINGNPEIPVAKPALSYSNKNQYTYPADTQVTSIIPQISGVTGTYHCTVTPAFINNFMTLDANNCNIYPNINYAPIQEEQTQNKTYTISLVDSDGKILASSPFTLSITGTNPPQPPQPPTPVKPTLSYESALINYTIGSGTKIITPTITPSTEKFVSCTSDKNLSPGISIDNTTCAITLTNNIQSPVAETYTITGTDSSNATAKTSITIDVAPMKAELIYGTNNDVSYTRGSGDSPVKPTMNANKVTSCSSSPSLPNGVTLSTEDCSITFISNKITENLPITNFTIIGTDLYKNPISRPITISINANIPNLTTGAYEATLYTNHSGTPLPDAGAHHGRAMVRADIDVRDQKTMVLVMNRGYAWDGAFEHWNGGTDIYDSASIQYYWDTSTSPAPTLTFTATFTNRSHFSNESGGIDWGPYNNIQDITLVGTFDSAGKIENIKQTVGNPITESETYWTISYTFTKLDSVPAADSFPTYTSDAWHNLP